MLHIKHNVYKMFCIKMFSIKMLRIKMLHINLEIINVVSRAGHALPGGTFHAVRSRVEPFALALLRSFLGLKFFAFAFRLPRSWHFCLYFSAPVFLSNSWFPFRSRFPFALTHTQDTHTHTVVGIRAKKILRYF
jgi:hypothetical protein